MNNRDDRVRSKASEGTAGRGPIPSDVLELDDVYSALSHPRRRYLCYTLQEDTEWRLIELATKVAAWEEGLDETTVSDAERQRVYVSLYHAHVPKLVDLNVVEFDEATETVAADEHTEQVLTALHGMGASLDANQERHARRPWDE